MLRTGPALGRAICFHDLEFARVPVEFRSSRGLPYVRRIRVGMPRIPPDVLHSVFYLYENRKDAEAGENPGGTGFIVSQYPGHLYAVTNWHVAVNHNHPVCPVIRLNTNDGGVDVRDLGPEDWEFIPGGDDIAIYPLILDRTVHQFASIPSNMFAARPGISPPSMVRNAIGVGEDAFMIGLFLDHAGVTTNNPSARFGNVSMLPNQNALIEQPTGYMGESYVVDMHSRSGFSGSPVFVYRTFGADLTVSDHRIKDMRFASNGQDAWRGDGLVRGEATFKAESMFQLLGIHWAQFPEVWEVGKKTLPESRKKHLVTDGASVEGMSGMTCVIPAWKIQDILDMPKFKGPREVAAKEIQDQIAAKYPRKPKPEASGASSAPPASDANPNAREDFTRLLGEAARKPPQAD